ncbi:MAG: hypothetical protein ABIC57_02935 [bacterium]
MSQRLLEIVPKEAQNGLKELWQRGVENQECRQWLKENYNIQFDRFQMRGVLKQLGIWKQKGVEKKELNLYETIERDKELNSLKAERDHFRKLYQTAIKESSGLDRIVNSIRELSPAIPEVRPKLFKTDTHKTSRPLSVVAPIADTHIGERVDPDQLGGLNQYNIDIFNRRLYGWVKKVLRLIHLRGQYANIPILYVPMLGDMVSGEIHLDTIKTNIDNVMNQMVRGASMLAQALVALSEHFNLVYVPCVVGNHGRISPKPYPKDKYVDWDFLLYQQIAAFCSNQKNIKLSIPKSFLHVFEVEGKKILMMHGDSIRMWQSIPYYGISRTVAQLRQVLQLRQRLQLERDLEELENAKASTEDVLDVFASYFDFIFLGHFHRHDELDIGTGAAFIAGCMKGGDEYSFGRLHTVSKPVQIVTFWDSERGYISKDIIYLSEFDNSKEMFRDVLPEVWSEGIIE